MWGGRGRQRRPGGFGWLDWVGVGVGFGEVVWGWGWVLGSGCVGHGCRVALVCGLVGVGGWVGDSGARWLVRVCCVAVRVRGGSW